MKLMCHDRPIPLSNVVHNYALHKKQTKILAVVLKDQTPFPKLKSSFYWCLFLILIN